MTPWGAWMHFATSLGFDDVLFWVSGRAAYAAVQKQHFWNLK
jgi:hypothetical protein